MLGGDGDAEKVGYKLTTDAAGETAWGTGDNAFTTAVATNYETDIATTIYLTVTDAADVTPGNYKDTVNSSVATRYDGTLDKQCFSEWYCPM